MSRPLLGRRFLGGLRRRWLSLCRPRNRSFFAAAKGPAAVGNSSLESSILGVSSGRALNGGGGKLAGRGGPKYGTFAGSELADAAALGFDEIATAFGAAGLATTGSIAGTDGRLGFEARTAVFAERASADSPAMTFDSSIPRRSSPPSNAASAALRSHLSASVWSPRPHCV